MLLAVFQGQHAAEVRVDVEVLSVLEGGALLGQ